MLSFNKRGSIPIAFLVILTIALLTFTLIAFSITKSNVLKETGKEAKIVEEFNMKKKGAEFSGTETYPVVLNKKKFWFLGDEVLDISVRKIYQ